MKRVVVFVLASTSSVQSIGVFMRHGDIPEQFVFHFKLYPLIHVRLKSLFSRISSWFGDDDGQDAIAVVDVNRESISMTSLVQPHGCDVLRWETPFRLRLTHWVNDTGDVELNVSLREVGATLSDAVLSFRVLWPLPRVRTNEIVKKKSHGRFLKSGDFKALWPLLTYFVQLHGELAPGGFDLDVDDDELEGLSSEKEEVTCIACGSFHIKMLHAKFYRCLSCGYEGGQGQAEVLEERQLASFNALSPELRSRSIEAELVEVARFITAAAMIPIKKDKLNEMDIINLKNLRSCQSKAIYGLKQIKLKMPELIPKEIFQRLDKVSSFEQEDDFYTLANDIRHIAVSLKNR